MSYPTPGDDYIDGRDVHRAVEELQDELKDYEEAVEEAEEALKDLDEEWEDAEDDLKAALKDLEEASDPEDIEAARAEIGRLENALEKYRRERREAGEAIIQAQKELADWREDYGELLEQLQELASEIDSDAQLIHEDKFVEYAQELVEDIGGKIPDYVVVDWEATAENLKVDYTAVEFGDDTYYYR